MTAGRSGSRKAYGTGRRHHRQAAPRPDRHRDAALRRRDDQVREFHRRRPPARCRVLTVMARLLVRSATLPSAPLRSSRSISAPSSPIGGGCALQAAPARCAAVVKADAYGLGAVQVAPALAAAGCRIFFVATLDEGIALRRASARRRDRGAQRPVPGAAGDFVERALIPVLNDLGQIAAWQRKRRAAVAADAASRYRHGAARPAAREFAALVASPAARRPGGAVIEPPRLRRRARPSAERRTARTRSPPPLARLPACAGEPRGLLRHLSRTRITTSTWCGRGPRSTASIRSPAGPIRCGKWFGSKRKNPAGPRH